MISEWDKYLEEKIGKPFPYREWDNYAYEVFCAFSRKTDYVKITFSSALPEINISMFSIEDEFLYEFSVFEDR